MNVKKIVLVLLVLILAGCTPVMDPAKWDHTMYCKTTQSCR